LVYESLAVKGLPLGKAKTELIKKPAWISHAGVFPQAYISPGLTIQAFPDIKAGGKPFVYTGRSPSYSTT
jgi:hypothetical protein